MAITRDRLSEGLTWEDYKARMTQNRDQVERNEQDVPLSTTDLVPFRNLSKPLEVLVIAEDWCGDVVANAPILARIARESGKLNLRVFLRDENKDLIAQFMNGPYESIPVFAFFDADMNEVGVFIERPKSVTELRERRTHEIHAANPELGPVGGPANELPEDVRNRLQAAICDMRAETTAFYVKETVRELGDMAGAIGIGKRAGRRGNLAGV